MTTNQKPILTRDPSVDVKTLLVKLIEISSKTSPPAVMDASINHLGMNIAVMARMSHKSRGEMKAMARKAFKDCLAMAEANYAQVSVPSEFGTN